MKFLALILLLVSGTAFGDVLYPKTTQQLERVTVKVTRTDGKSGGTGVILRSLPSKSYVLTNKHVCEVAENGGFIHTSTEKYQIERYLPSKNHDVCLVMVNDDLGVTTKLAKENVTQGEYIVVSGHPYLLPHMVQPGHVSGTESITLITGVKKCSKKDYDSKGFWCWWFGGLPIITTLEAQAISPLIAPGNSGSAVFNRAGEIVGLVFAGIGRTTNYGYMVPYGHVRNFLKTEIYKRKWKKPKNSRSLFDMLFSKLKVYTRTTNLRYVNENLTFPAIYGKDYDNFYEVYACMQNEKDCLGQ